MAKKNFLVLWHLSQYLKDKRELFLNRTVKQNHNSMNEVFVLRRKMLPQIGNMARA